MEYIFKAKNSNIKFDYSLLCSIEERLSDGITYDETIYFLHWLISRIEKNYAHVKGFKYETFCGYAFELAVTILDKLKLETYGFDMQSIVSGESKGGLHVLTKLKLNIRQLNEIMSKEFIIDPTFGQFCRADRCQKDGWFLGNGWNTQLPPDPGYFLSLSKEGTKLGTSILNDGFFEFSEENFKLYCDAFYSTYNKDPKNNIKTKDYMNAIYLYEWKKIYCHYDKDIRIPSEIKKQYELKK